MPNLTSTPDSDATILPTPINVLPTLMQSPVPTTNPNGYLTPIMRPTSKPTPIGTIPDSQIAELETVGVHLAYLRCDDGCRAQVVPPMRLDEFVAAVGTPDKVGSSVQDPVNFAVFLIYGDRGIVALAERPYNQDAVNMTPTMRVTTVFLYRARTLEELETETHGPLRMAQGWPGFGPVRRLPK
ncbi:MAG: hypothetical protein HZB53_07845 [Chloroflexi bacterium]|nr:hypothetical protein [Chloroflexota bacterium]